MLPPHLQRRSLAVLLGLLGADLAAQCTLAGQSGQGVGGVDGTVFASTWWDPDGPGPISPQLVLAGEFPQAGDRITRNITAYDPSTGTWADFAGGLSGLRAHAVAVLPNGELVAAGNFSPTNGAVADHVRRWTGSAWTPLGGSVNGTIFGLATSPNGDLVAAGQFTQIGGTAANRIARWDGTSWHPLGNGLDNTVLAVAAAPNGDIVAVGYFLNAGGVAAARVARWNGVAWSPLGAGLGGVPLTVACAANGTVLVGGTFTTAGGSAANRLAAWNGTAWSPFGIGANAQVQTILAHANGDFTIGGQFTSIDGVAAARIATWSGGTWSALSSGMPTGDVLALQTATNGDLYAGGHFFQAGGVPADRVARWNGQAWSTLADGVPGTSNITAMTTLRDGRIVVAGTFQRLDLAENNIAVRSNGPWQPLGSGCGPGVRAIVQMPNGDVVIGGSFTAAGGQPAAAVARWDGAAWHAVGNLAGCTVSSLAVLPDGRLAAGFSVVPSGNERVRVWDGSTWTTIGTTPGTITSLAVLADGSLCVGGPLWGTISGGGSTTNTQGVARWNGSIWIGMGQGLSGDSSQTVFLCPLPDGSLVAVGTFTNSGATPLLHAARWNGTAWTAMGSGLPGYPLAITRLPDGGVGVVGMALLTGTFGTSNHVARWNGSSWTAIGAGLAGEYLGSYPSGNAITLGRNGDLWIGGRFRTVDDRVSNNLAYVVTTCPAAAIPAGAGCGPVTLAADEPWTGTTWTSRTTGLPNAALVFAVSGFAATSLPLDAVFATAAPGCTLHVYPDAVELGLAGNGAFATQLDVPANPALVGSSFRHQVVSMALDATLAVTATDALRLVVGAW
ncbi:MAG: hypothetical protein JNK15_13225 [Planctomycetes bacterium]|nr:hypothetical protein [Planctomycetota bacterium]